MWPDYKEGIQERRPVRAMGMEEGTQPDKANKGWAENVEKQDRKWFILTFPVHHGPITSPSPNAFDDHLSWSWQVPLKSQYFLQRLCGVTT